jgi:hypothetical protein
LSDDVQDLSSPLAMAAGATGSSADGEQMYAGVATIAALLRAVDVCIRD